jgi:hypothetical protein
VAVGPVGLAAGPGGPPLWGHVLLAVGLVEFLYYDMLPTQLHLMMAVAALLFRERAAPAGEAQAAGAGRRSGMQTQETLQPT